MNGSPRSRLAARASIATRTSRRWHQVAGAVLASLLLGGCGGIQSALDPQGPQATRIAELSWVLFALSAVVWFAVTAFLLSALFRSRGEEGVSTAEITSEPGKRRVVIGATVVTILILFGLLVYSVSIDRAVSIPVAENPLTIEVIGYQFWWEIRYLDENPSRIFITANEIHIPTGQPVRLNLITRDVIHSFWVPNLHGKRDMVPGHENTLELQADEPGVFRGQCAEFCGLQHALMGFLVIAETPEDFAAWRDRQLQPAVAPEDPTLVQGQEVFLTAQCVLCHTVRGTLAGAAFGPDLTHFGSRRTIAAATLPNNRGNLAGWILDPQHIKPGNLMPPTHLDPNSLHALLAYLESLE